MLKQKGLPGWFWGEAVLTAVYLLNRVPYKANEGQTPFELWYDKKPVVHHLKIFGCVVYVRNTRPNLKKLEDRRRRMIFIGYEHGTKAYRAYDPAMKKVMITYDLVFDEAARWEWIADEAFVGGSNQGAGDFTVHYWAWPSGAVTAEEAEMEPHTPQVILASPGVIDAPVSPAGDYGKPVFDVPNEESLDADHDDAPLRLQAVSDIIGAAATPGYAARPLGTSGGDQLFMINAEEPSSVD
jgi:hypothetical protein